MLNLSKLFINKENDFGEVTELIAQDFLLEALESLMAQGKITKNTKLEHMAIGCMSRFSKNEIDYHKGLNSEVFYNKEYNKIIKNCLSVYSSILNYHKLKRKVFYRKIRQILSFILIPLLFMFLAFYLIKMLQPNEMSDESINNKSLNKAYKITDFKIIESNCIDTTFAVVKIKNTGENDLKDIRFKWIFDERDSTKFEIYEMAVLKKGEIDDIHLRLKDETKLKIGNYQSKLLVYLNHPIQMQTEINQSFEIKKCKSSSSIYLKGKQVRITYDNRIEKKIRLKKDNEILLPANSTILNIIELPD